MILLLCVSASLRLIAAGAPTPFVGYSVDSTGAPDTNAITIIAWPDTNAVVGVSTNLVWGTAHTYYPAASNGYFAGYLLPNIYKMSSADISQAVLFGIIATNTTQNLAQVTGFPVPTFMNFTLAQFSDVGTAAYSNTIAFVLNSYRDMTNSLAVVPATNTYSGITSALSFPPATNNIFAGPTFSMTTNGGRIWLLTNIAWGVSPNTPLPDGSVATGTNGGFWVRTNGAWLAK